MEKETVKELKLIGRYIIYTAVQGYLANKLTDYLLKKDPLKYFCK